MKKPILLHQPHKHHFRRNSLDALIKLKNNSVDSEEKSFLKSLNSLEKIKDKAKEELPQLRYEKQMDDNIYFNPHSRANYFKNLIDSYFVKSQSKEKSKLNQANDRKGSYLLRRSSMDKKNSQDVGFSSKQKKSDKLIMDKSAQFKSSFETKSQLPDSQRADQQKKKQSIYLRYRQHNANLKSANNPNTSISQQSFSSMLQNKNLNAEQSSYSQLSFLPKITEAIDDNDENLEIQSHKDYIMTADTFIRSQNSFSQLQNQKLLVYENSIKSIFMTEEMEKKYRIKQFKHQVFMQRYKRAIQCGAQIFWKPYKFNELSLVTPLIHPLKDILYRMIPHPTAQDHYIIHPRPLYKKLVSNNCQQLILMFIQLIRQVRKTQSRIINNNINLQNLYYINGRLRVLDWQYAAFRDESQIQGNYFQARVEPILKCQSQWLVEPEYLATEILESIEDSKRQFDMWQGENLSDVYSLGIAFLQIITLIPMNIQQKTFIKSKPTMRPRKGLLSTTNRSLGRIIEKQKALRNKMQITLERQVCEKERNDKFFGVLLGMIEPNRAKRIGIEEILRQLE